ncbi:hypothetical protein A2690_04140 [Candidatus Roizmanbacteria bacterium RIFCSPHIGHO2_01_FULL_39_12b]|uniref:Glycosyltransferase 2-like domain-containing protein n=1 Tax=Candidatus Roizmanbacteria bacterium RIFCSPHIGHO2_01_FULL_39_12b TaxID=1802030 RepID=A0A1F7GD40_9BACT|nr:MAG: hypothetical protein A2690_04140 [Candidatus Roizmanbacteria bacterium RIFCSPHIGHO2_01_FULL_39_12b]OGK47132.1 MAG: hypothetical protein A3B46_01865 [Candidatus Roizmanbacteria bacterium RIFCSPLOWO2_01_FULL_39_19]
MNDICVVISLYNEEKLIKDCIVSARKLTSNVIVVDTESTDNTAGVARSMGVKVYSYKKAPIIEPSRNFAIEKADAEWAYILDADERFSQELVDEIKHIIKETNFTHFKGPRLNMFAQKWPMKHGGWWPDPIVRLIKKNSFIKWPKEIHSTPVIKGEMGTLKSPLLHFSQGNLNEMVEKTIRFEDKESLLLYRGNRKASTLTFFRKFLAEFYRRFIRDKGILDGPTGLIASIYQAYSKTVTYLLLYEKSLNN